MGKNGRGHRHSSQSQTGQSIQGLKPARPVAPEPRSAMPQELATNSGRRETPEPMVATSSMKPFDYKRAQIALETVIPENEDKTRKALAGLPTAIRTQGLARVLAMVKDKDTEKAIDKLLDGLVRLELLSRSDATDAEKRRQSAIKSLTELDHMRRRRRLEHEAIQFAGWLKALYPSKDDNADKGRG